MTPAHLPVPSDAVLGRDADLGTLLEWLGGDDARRLITLVGPGGIGKTRLAIEAARLARDRFDRVTFVALEHVRDPADVLPADRAGARRAAPARPDRRAARDRAPAGAATSSCSTTSSR